MKSTWHGQSLADRLVWACKTYRPVAEAFRGECVIKVAHVSGKPHLHVNVGDTICTVTFKYRDEARGRDDRWITHFGPREPRVAESHATVDECVRYIEGLRAAARTTL